MGSNPNAPLSWILFYVSTDEQIGNHWALAISAWRLVFEERVWEEGNDTLFERQVGLMNIPYLDGAEKDSCGRLKWIDGYTICFHFHTPYNFVAVMMVSEEEGVVWCGVGSWDDKIKNEPLVLLFLLGCAHTPAHRSIHDRDSAITHCHMHTCLYKHHQNSSSFSFPLKIYTQSQSIPHSLWVVFSCTCVVGGYLYLESFVDGGWWIIIVYICWNCCLIDWKVVRVQWAILR